MENRFSWTLIRHPIPNGGDLEEPAVFEIRGDLPRYLIGWTIAWQASGRSAQRLLTFDRHIGLLRRLALALQCDSAELPHSCLTSVPISSTRHFGQQPLAALALGLDEHGEAANILYVTKDALRAEVLFEVVDAANDGTGPTAWLSVVDDLFDE